MLLKLKFQRAEELPFMMMATDIRRAMLSWPKRNGKNHWRVKEDCKEIGQDLKIWMLISGKVLFLFFFFFGIWHAELLTPTALEVWNPNHWITDVQFKRIFNFQLLCAQRYGHNKQSQSPSLNEEDSLILTIKYGPALCYRDPRGARGLRRDRNNPVWRTRKDITLLIGIYPTTTLTRVHKIHQDTN